MIRMANSLFYQSIRQYPSLFEWPTLLQLVHDSKKPMLHEYAASYYCKHQQHYRHSSKFDKILHNSALGV